MEEKGGVMRVEKAGKEKGGNEIGREKGKRGEAPSNSNISLRH